MQDYSIINLKTDPKLKKEASALAEKLGISLSAVLNNALRNFTVERQVVFAEPETPNKKTIQKLKTSRMLIESGEYHKFDNSEASINFLRNKLK